MGSHKKKKTVTDTSKKQSTIAIQLDFSEEERQVIYDRCDYHEWHWKMYSFMNSSIINGVSVVELKMNDFISDYFTFCDKERSNQFVEYVMSKMTLQNKFELFKKLLTHIDIEELGEINETDYSVVNKFEQIIKYRNLFAHSVLDQNFKNPVELKNRKRIKLQNLSAKDQKQNIRYITIDEHREMLDLLVDIECLLMDIVIDTNEEKSPINSFNHNTADVQRFEPPADPET